MVFKNKKDVSKEVSFLFDRLSSIYEGIFLLQELSDKTIAKVSSFGERLSSYIIANAAKELLDTNHKESRDLVVTNDEYLNAQVDYKTTNKNIISFFKENKHQVTVLGGFISSNIAKETTTLGRGGSDFSAAILANILAADTLEIWTDVSGMFTAHPKLVSQAQPIPRLSYYEAMELSHFGAKVIYPPTLQPIIEKEIPILQTTATTNEGIAQLYQTLQDVALSQKQEDKRNIVLAEKAYRLIESKRLQDIDRSKLAAAIKTEREQGNFNLYRFVAKY